MQFWRSSEAEKMRQRLRQQAQKSSLRVISPAEQAMDETGWREWKNRRKQAPMIAVPEDAQIRSRRLERQAESMRKLRAHRRSLDIWQVYKSDMHPRHFRRAVAHIPIAQRQRQVYQLGGLLRRAA